MIFSEDDLLYAYDFGEVDKKMFPTIDNLRKAITTFQVDGKCISIQKDEIDYPISPFALQEINDEYNGRNLLDVIGIFSGFELGIDIEIFRIHQDEKTN